MASQTFPNETTEWGQIAVTVDVNKVDLAHLEPLRARLAVVADSAKAIKLKQESFKAQVQQATRDLEALTKEGRDLFSRLRFGVRTQYGAKVRS
jgi:ABC-type dipeptide/oligopeptide/nickel transport system permease subunit